jgi:hypothetical protein
METFPIALTHTYQFQEYDLIFETHIQLPFPPYMGLTIEDSLGLMIPLMCDENNATDINYNINTNQFSVHVAKLLRYPISNLILDRIVKKHLDNGWQRKDNTDINKLKELMNEIEKRLEK